MRRELQGEPLHAVLQQWAVEVDEKADVLPCQPEIREQLCLEYGMHLCDGFDFNAAS
jgi:hypothetical protein